MLDRRRGERKRRRSTGTGGDIWSGCVDILMKRRHIARPHSAGDASIPIPQCLHRYLSRGRARHRFVLIRGKGRQNVIKSKRLIRMEFELMLTLLIHQDPEHVLPTPNESHLNLPSFLCLSLQRECDRRRAGCLSYCCSHLIIPTGTLIHRQFLESLE